MVRRRLVAPAAIVALGFAVLAFVPRQVPPAAGVIFAQSDKAAPHCVPIGGTVMTDLAAIGQSTTLGTAIGDLRGAVWLPPYSTYPRVRMAPPCSPCSILRAGDGRHRFSGSRPGDVYTGHAFPVCGGHLPDRDHRRNREVRGRYRDH